MLSTDDPVYIGLDQKFDKVLADMKPHVLRLPHKTGELYCLSTLFLNVGILVMYSYKFKIHFFSFTNICSQTFYLG